MIMVVIESAVAMVVIVVVVVVVIVIFVLVNPDVQRIVGFQLNADIDVAHEKLH
jgi:hypothetical protein